MENLQEINCVIKELKIKNAIAILNEKSGELINLRLPKAINKYFFCLALSIIQFDATWIRSGRCGKLIDLSLNDETLLKNITDRRSFFLLFHWHRMNKDREPLWRKLASFFERFPNTFTY